MTIVYDKRLGRDMLIQMRAGTLTNMSGLSPTNPVVLLALLATGILAEIEGLDLGFDGGQRLAF